MKFYRYLLVIFLLSGIYTHVYTDIDPTAIKKHKLQYSLEWKTYSVTASELISFFGGKRRKFVSPEWYYGEAGYGAIFGKRAGYLEGGIIFGYQSLIDMVLLDVRMFLGAGGGGGAPQGGGFIVHPTVGLGYQIFGFPLFAELGYIHFVNGDISSFTAAVNVNMNTWLLTYQPKPQV